MALPSRETAIWLALKEVIDRWRLETSVAVAWPGKLYSPNGEDFLAVHTSFQPPERMDIAGSCYKRAGTLTLVYAAGMDQDPAVYTEVAGQLAARFTNLQTRAFGVCVRIVSAPQVAGAYRDDNYWRTPIIVQWAENG